MKPQKVKRKEKPKGRKKRNRGEAGQTSVLNRYLFDLPTSYTLGDFRVLNLKLSWPIAENSNQPYPLSSVPSSDFLTKPTTQMLSWGAFCQLYTTFEMCFTLLSKQKQVIGFCQARAQSARARRACALRALGLLLADGTPTVGRGKTFWRVN